MNAPPGGITPGAPGASGGSDPAASLVLLARMQRGEIAARDELVQRYWPRLERWARGRVPEAARPLCDTADLVQDTMMAALDHLQHFEPDHEGALLAYLRAAVLNRVRQLAHRVRRRGDHGALHEQLPDGDASPLEIAIGQDAVERYERALARLRPDDRDAIHLKIELDLPYDQIAAALGSPSLAAARMAVSRALARLAVGMQRRG